jgi:methionyl-tRNA formyltransferase
VKTRALAYPIQVLQPERLRQLDVVLELEGLAADVFVVVAYGKILPPALLGIPAKGCVNVHGSILPRWRGAAPIQRAVLAGDRATGVTLMKMDEGMDTGPMLATRETDIGPDETSGELSVRLAQLGAEILSEDLPRYLKDELTAVPQDEATATKAPPLEKGEGVIDWSRSAQSLHDHVRGMQPWPGAFTRHGEKRLLVHRAKPEEATPGAAPGTVVSLESTGIAVACGSGRLIVLEAQLEGRKRAQAADIARGLRLESGTRFG